jgi:DHA2 family methylenomycin A resistance protein-like MFS transporter
MGSLIFACIELGREDAPAELVLSSFALALICAVSFVLLQRFQSTPKIPGRLFQATNAKISMLVGFICMVGYFGLPFLMSLYLQQTHGL